MRESLEFFWLWCTPRWLWRLAAWVRYPRRNWRSRQKWRQRPHPGDWVEDCRGRVLQVTGFGEAPDDLLLSDGSSASWMHCCEKAEKP